MEQEVEIKKLINEEKYLIRDTRLRAKIYLVLQVLGLSSVVYLGLDPLDFVFDETRLLLMFIGVLVYLLFFTVLTFRIVLKKELELTAVKKQLTLILILTVIPCVVFTLVALTDIF